MFYSNYLQIIFLSSMKIDIATQKFCKLLNFPEIFLKLFIQNFGTFSILIVSNSWLAYSSGKSVTWRVCSVFTLGNSSFERYFIAIYQHHQYHWFDSEQFQIFFAKILLLLSFFCFCFWKINSQSNTSRLYWLTKCNRVGTKVVTVCSLSVLY